MSAIRPMDLPVVAFVKRLIKYGFWAFTASIVEAKPPEPLMIITGITRTAISIIEAWIKSVQHTAKKPPMNV